MKKIEFILNAIRFSPKQILAILGLILIYFFLFYVEDSILSYEDKNKVQRSILKDKQSENESYTYVEDILEEHHNYLNKFKSIKAPDLFWLQEEIEWLIPSWIQINETKINSEEFVIRWLAPNLRTVDFLLSILNTYNNYYGWFDGEIVLVNTSKKDTLFSFRIEWDIDEQKIINKIYSWDIDLSKAKKICY